MITLTKTYEITSGKAPFTINWSADDGCITFDAYETTTSSSVVSVTYHLATTSCTGDITLLVVSACGNSQSATFAAASPCDDLLIQNVARIGTSYTFTATATSPTCTSLTYTWFYDSALFKLVGQVDSTNISNLQLSLRTARPGVPAPILPASTEIRVRVTDCRGCVEEGVYTLTFCQGTPPSVVVDLYPTGGNDTYLSGTATLQLPTDCSANVYDPSTYMLTLPTGVSGNKISDGLYTFSYVGEETDTLTGTYIVKTTDGTPSRPGNIIFVIHEPAGSTISIPNRTITLPCDAEVGDIFEIVIDTQVVVSAGSEVDWTSWQLVQPPIPLSESITLGVNSSGQRVILYEVPNPVGSDIFSWTVADTNGNYADSTVYTTVQCPVAPTGVEDETEVVCGGATTLDVLANDLGNGSQIQRPSIQVQGVPAGLTVTIQSDYNLRIVAANGINGEFTFEYRVKNTSGTYSEWTEVTVDVVCAGTSANVTLCN